MPKYKRDEIELEEDEVIQSAIADPNTDPKEKSWAKRYSDLRSYSAKKENELQKQIDELNKNVAALSQNQTLPKTKEEVEAWAAKYPDVAKIVRTIALTEIQEQRQDIDARFKELDERKLEQAKTEAEAELARLHPDFFTEIKDSDEFYEWIMEQSENLQNSMFANDTDAKWAASTISLYKQETGYGKPKKKTIDPREAARNVRVPSNAQPDNYDKSLWSESKVNKLSGVEFEMYMEEIDAAIKAGNFVYDISGAAR